MSFKTGGNAVGITNGNILSGGDLPLKPSETYPFETYTFYIPKGCYVIKGLETSAIYSLKLSTSGDVAYLSDGVSIYHQGSDYPVYLAAKLKQQELNYIKSALTDSRPGNRYKGLFINNISIPDLYFELNGDWDGLAPGYYELKSSMGSISLKSDKFVFELQPGLQMKAGEELWGRMVSKSGVSTLWQNARSNVTLHP